MDSQLINKIIEYLNSEAEFEHLNDIKEHINTMIEEAIRDASKDDNQLDIPL